MLKINILAVGSVKETYLKQAIEEYKKRLSRFCSINVIEVNEQSNLTEEKKIEAECALLQAKFRGYVILLDIRGEQVSSEQMGGLINDLKNKGEGEITFVIGGSNGVNPELRRRADKMISFGQITLPHQLFRVVLLEQIYRGFTISAGMPYHK